MTKKTFLFDNGVVQIAQDEIWIQGKRDMSKVASFGLKLLYRISDPYGAISWLMAVTQDGEDDRYVTLSHQEFASVSKFHEALLREGFVFKGDNPQFDQLKEALICDAKRAEAITSLGYHAKSGLYFFANGALDKRGNFLEPDAFSMIEYQKNAYFLPFLAETDNADFETYQRIFYEPGDLRLKAWLIKASQAFGELGVIPVCFRLAAAFRDIAFQHVRFFPILYLRGAAGSGKSTCARSMTAIDGKSQDEVSLKTASTVKALPRRLAQISNSVLWFDEYENVLPQAVIGQLQSIYDGGGYQRAAMGYTNHTNSVKINSALMLTSNHTPDTDYMRQRCVFVTFSSTNKPQEQRDAYNALMGLEQGNLSSVIADVLQYRELIEKDWLNTHEEIFKTLLTTTQGVENRILNNLAVILTPICILEKKKIVNLEAVFGLNKPLLEYGREVCLKQQEILTGRSDLTQFFDVVSYCAERGLLQPDVDFTYCGDGHTLALRLPRVFPVYLKEFRAMYNRIGIVKEELEQAISQHASFQGEHNVRFGKEGRIFKAHKFAVDVFSESFALPFTRNEKAANVRKPEKKTRDEEPPHPAFSENAPESGNGGHGKHSQKKTTKNTTTTTTKK